MSGKDRNQPCAMSEFKKIEEVNVPDTRMERQEIFDSKSGAFRNITFADYYRSVSGITLHVGVPDGVHSHFDVAKNLLLYSWYVYRFLMVAEMQASASLELAIKEKCARENEPQKRGLKNLIGLAESKCWVKNDGFSMWQRVKEGAEKYREDRKILCEIAGIPYVEVPFSYDYIAVIKDSIPYIRNYYAHGAKGYGPGGHLRLQICAEFINQLFPKPPGP